MFELLKFLTPPRTLAVKLVQSLFCHRAIYAELAICHGSACLTTGEPALYGTMAVLYAILAVRG